MGRNDGNYHVKMLIVMGEMMEMVEMMKMEEMKEQRGALRWKRFLTELREGGEGGGGGGESPRRHFMMRIILINGDLFLLPHESPR